MLRFNIPSYFDLSPLYLFLLFLQDIFYNNNRISGVIDVRIRHGTAAKGFNWKEGHDVVGQRYWFRFTGVLSASALSVSFEYDVDTVGRGGQGWRWGAKWKGDLAGALIQNGGFVFRRATQDMQRKWWRERRTRSQQISQISDQNNLVDSSSIIARTYGS